MATRIESSIVASLGELRSIHMQRIADERAAVDAARRAEVELAQRQADAIRAAELARVRAAHEAEIALHEARAAAEREARLRQAQAQAAEQQRLDAQLAAERAAEEIALHREVSRKQRPRWMMIVTALAVCLAVAGGALAVQHQREAATAREREAEATEQREAALREVADIERELQTADQELSVLRDKVDAAVKQVIAAQTVEVTRRAEAEVLAQRQALADASRRRAELARQREEQIRKSGFHLENCAQTALGCMEK